MTDQIKLTATETDLSRLHGLTAELMRGRLEAAINTNTPLPPAELAVIVKFLKDNDIECTREDMEKKFGKLLELPGPTFDEVEEKYG